MAGKAEQIIGQAQLATARRWLAEADAAIITAGAGMGVDSNLPDFRGDEGFWQAYPLYKQLGFNFAEMADPVHFRQNPALAWGFYGHRLNLYRATTPHRGFQLLLDWLGARALPYFVVTSNVDGQFQKAGFADEQIWEIHGSIHRLQCLDNCTTDIYHNDLPDIDVDMTTMLATSYPQCPNCPAPLRPNILMFGDYGFNDGVCAMQQQKWNAFIRAQQDAKVVVIEMGAGTAIPSIRRIGEHITSQLAAASLIRINPREAHIPNGINAIPLPTGALAGVAALLPGERT